MQKVKNKICKVCGKSFKPHFSSLQSVCSSKCEYEYKRSKASKSFSKTNNIPIRSKKRAKQEKEYLKLNKEFLSLPENQYCPVMFEIYGLKVKTTEIHHKAGRIGKLLTHVPYFLAVSNQGHRFIHENVYTSICNGWIIKRNSIDFSKL